MKLLLWSDDLIGRMRLESLWTASGVSILKKNASEAPDCIAIDLAARDVLQHIARLRAAHPAVPIVAYAAKFDEERFLAAKAAGADDVAALSSIIHRVDRICPRA